jgi:NADH-ubiquinone oxidoreductase chain 5
LRTNYYILIRIRPEEIIIQVDAMHTINILQDVRKMGGLVTMLPFTYTIFLIGSFSLIAVPFLTGYYSKDLIILVGSAQYLISGSIGYWFTTVVAILTAIYSTRAIYLAFLSPPNGYRITYNTIHETPLIIAIPLIILAIFSIFSGFLTKEFFVGIGSDFFGSSLFTHPNHSLLIDAEFGLPLYVKLLPILGIILGIFSVIFVYFLYPLILVRLIENTLFRAFYRYLNRAHFFDNLYTSFIIHPSLNFGYITNKVLDRGVMEILGPLGLSSYFNTTSNKIVSLDSRYLPTYALYIFIGGFILISFLLYVGDPKYLILYLITLLFL